MIAAVAGRLGVYALIGIGLFMVYKNHVAQIEARVAAQIEAEAAKLETQYVRDTAADSAQHAEALASVQRDHEQQKSALVAEIDGLRATLEGQAREEPFNTGNDFERRLAHVMCRIAEGGDTGGRQACDLQARQTYSPDTALVVTVTANTAAEWAEQCDAGQRDFCDYAVMGLTTQGALTLLSWLHDVDRYQAQLNAYTDSQDKVLDGLVFGGPSEDQ
jgi:hypothetical protein